MSEFKFHDDPEVATRQQKALDEVSKIDLNKMSFAEGIAWMRTQRSFGYQNLMLAVEFAVANDRGSLSRAARGVGKRANLEQAREENVVVSPRMTGRNGKKAKRQRSNSR